MPVPGWYVDPADDHGLRYWDGAGWTEHTRAPRASDPPSHTPPAATASHPVDAEPRGAAGAAGPLGAPPRGRRARAWPWAVFVVLVLVALSVAVSSTVLRDGEDAATVDDVVAAVEAQDVDCEVARPVHPPGAVVEELRLIPGSFVVAGSTTAEDEAAMAASIEPVAVVAQDLPDTAGYDLLRCNDAWIVLDSTSAHAVLLGPSTEGALEVLEGIGVPVEVLQLTA